MNEPIHVAFLWHQHQPYYKDIVRGRYVLPWARLHAIKDYLGLLLVLKEFPEVRCTINLVPSLVIQLQEYAAGVAEDEHLRLTRRRAEDLTEAERLFILDQFFVGNAPKIVRPFARYGELLDKRRPEQRSPAQALGDFSAAELRDLQVWATLAWFHPLVVEGDAALAELRRKGRDFSEADKEAMLRSQEATLRRVVPEHAAMAETGQIELSTTPFYHPILPLLCNMESARESLPGLPMPEVRSDMRADAKRQIEAGLESHRAVFGRAPTGLWPAEGSVSMDILPLLAGRGLKWIATDEGILARSAGVDLSRDSSASLRFADDLYQPYALPGGPDLPAIVFRDRAMADAIGFEYHRGNVVDGAVNLVWRITEAQRRCSAGPKLVSIILDGENPWDYYDQAGLGFLRELFGRLSAEKSIVTTRLTDYVTAHPPQKQLARLHAGSWIYENFAIWIGEKEDRAAWSLVAETREALMARARRDPPVPPEALARAWEEIYVAEGSDWCWWLGGDHTTELDYTFDQLFRNHLANVYLLIGETVPEKLWHPLGKPPRYAPQTTPQGPLAAVVDGEITNYYEWAAAGHYPASRANAAMRRGAADPVADVYYGRNDSELLIRLDPADGSLRQDDLQVRIVFHHPRRFAVTASGLGGARPQVTVEAAEAATPVRAAAGRIFEAAIPISLLAAGPGDHVEFSVEIVRAGAPVQRVPESGQISMTPAPAQPS
jgi:alpha-amylase/alpha-mannosidase (GH57 family)